MDRFKDRHWRDALPIAFRALPKSTKPSSVDNDSGNASRLFNYRPLKNEDSIRLLNLEPGSEDDPIRCQLLNVRLSSNPRYEAISYTWGRNDYPKLISVNDVQIEVTETLYKALHHFRLPKHRRTLWADAICINQIEAIERSKQVAMMKKIYETANTTLIFLGPSLPNKDLPFPVSVESDQLVFDLMEKARANLKNEDESSEQRRHLLAKGIMINESVLGVSQTDKLNAILNLLSREWFQRIWVMQELAVSKDPLLFWGNHWEPWDALVDLIQATADDIPGAIYPGLAAEYIIDRPNRLARRRQRYQQEGGSPMHNLLSISMKYFTATNPRDKVFALLGLVHDEGTITADYTLSTQEVFINATVSSFKEADTILCEPFQLLGMVSLSANGRYRSSLPSWTPDFTASSEFTRVFSSLTGQYYAGGDEGIESVFTHEGSPTLLLRGKVIDTIRRTEPSPPVPVAYAEVEPWRRRCRAFAEQSAPYPTGEHFPEVWWRLQICDIVVQNDGASPRPAERFGRYYLDERVSAIGKFQGLTVGDSANEIDKQIALYHTAMNHSCLGLPLCVTKNGYLGWVPRTTQVGDCICIFSGATAPFILRQRKDGFYEVIGDAYIHGIMHGEALIREGFQWEKIGLR
jgi:hypothetical protein